MTSCEIVTMTPLPFVPTSTNPSTYTITLQWSGQSSPPLNINISPTRAAYLQKLQTILKPHDLATAFLHRTKLQDDHLRTLMSVVLSASKVTSTQEDMAVLHVLDTMYQTLLQTIEHQDQMHLSPCDDSDAIKQNFLANLENQPPIAADAVFANYTVTTLSPHFFLPPPVEFTPTHSPYLSSLINPTFTCLNFPAVTITAARLSLFSSLQLHAFHIVPCLTPFLDLNHAMTYYRGHPITPFNHLLPLFLASPDSLPPLPTPSYKQTFLQSLSSTILSLGTLLHNTGSYHITSQITTMGLPSSNPNSAGEEKPRTISMDSRVDDPELAVGAPTGAQTEEEEEEEDLVDPNPNPSIDSDGEEWDLPSSLPPPPKEDTFREFCRLLGAFEQLLAVTSRALASRATHQTLSAERATLTTGPLPLLPANPTLSVPTHSPTPILTGLMAGLTCYIRRYSQLRVFWLRGRLASVAEEQTGGGEARELWRQIDNQVTVCVPGMTRELQHVKGYVRKAVVQVTREDAVVAARCSSDTARGWEELLAKMKPTEEEVAASKARVKSPKPLQTFVDEDGMVVVSTQGEADGGSEWTKEEAVGAAEVVEDSGSSSAGDLIEFDPDAMEVDSSGNNKSLTESMESLVQGLLDWNSMGVEGWTNNS